MIKKLWKRLISPPEFSKKQEHWLTAGGMLAASLSLSILILWIGTLNLQIPRLLYYFRDLRVVILNYIPVAVLMLVLYMLFNRAWISYLITAVITFVMAFVNYYKVVFRAEPFTALDIKLIAEAAGIGGNYTFRIPKLFWLGLAMILCTTVLLARYSRGKIRRKYWWSRIVAVLLCFGFSQWMWSAYYSDAMYHHSFFETDYSVFNDWKEPERMAKRGFLYSFLVSINDLIIQEPPNYDPKMAEGILAEYEPQQIPEDKRVNVVIHMLESFSDLSEFDLPFTVDPYDTWHRLEEESYHGTIITDTVGGGTVNAERSVMTGFTYVHPNYNVPVNSHIQYFNKNGYFTDATHPGNEWFYNRKRVDERLGFQRGLFIENYFRDFEGAPLGTDEALFPILRDLYTEKAAEEQPYFGFHVTYQNHSPYEGGFLKGKEYMPRGQLKEETYFTLNNYLDGVNDTAAQVAAYVDRFREDEEPVVLVFFGDHKPSLGEANSMYTELGIDVENGSPEGNYNLYATPYLIWANDAAKETLDSDFLGQGPTISPSYLMNEIFGQCGWKGNAWMQYQSMVQKDIPVIHWRKWFYVDGKMTHDLSESVEALRLQRNRVEFYYRNNLIE